MGSRAVTDNLHRQSYRWLFVFKVILLNPLFFKNTWDITQSSSLFDQMKWDATDEAFSLSKD